MLYSTSIDGPNPPDHLQWINMPIVSAAYCSQQLESFGLSAVTERQICSGETPEPTEDYGSCHVSIYDSFLCNNLIYHMQIFTAVKGNLASDM